MKNLILRKLSLVHQAVVNSNELLTSNSTLRILPMLHATILTIILAASTAFTVYVYQLTNTAKENLYSLRHQVQFAPPPYHGGSSEMDQVLYTECMKNGQLDVQKVREVLFKITLLFSFLDSSSLVGTPTTQTDVQPAQVHDAGKTFLILLNMIASSYPYGIDLNPHDPNLDSNDIDESAIPGDMSDHSREREKKAELQ